MCFAMVDLPEPGRPTVTTALGLSSPLDLGPSFGFLPDLLALCDLRFASSRNSENELMILP
jgi:hypothetical protein